MIEEGWTFLEKTHNTAKAEALRGLLEAQGIPVLLSQEGTGRYAFPVTVGPLGQIDIYVPASRLEEAHEVIEAYYSGAFEDENENP